MQEVALKITTRKKNELKKLQEQKKEVKKELEKKGHKKTTGEIDAQKKEESKEKEKEKDHDLRWKRGEAAVQKALAYAEKEGITKKELESILKKISNRFGFSKLLAEQTTTNWIISGSMSNLKK